MEPAYVVDEIRKNEEQQIRAEEMVAIFYRFMQDLSATHILGPKKSRS